MVDVIFFQNTKAAMTDNIYKFRGYSKPPAFNTSMMDGKVFFITGLI